MSSCKWYFRENDFDWAFMMSSEAGEKYSKINSGNMGREYIPLFCWLIIKKTCMTMTVERSLPSLTTLLLPYFKFFSPLMHKYKPVFKDLLNKFKIGLTMAQHESFFWNKQEVSEQTAEVATGHIIIIGLEELLLRRHE